MRGRSTSMRLRPWGILAMTAGVIVLALLFLARELPVGTPNATSAGLLSSDATYIAAQHPGAPLPAIVAAPTPATSACGTVDMRGNAMEDGTAARRAAACFQEAFQHCATTG